MNRLQLDFSLESNRERKEFLDKYLMREEFIKFPLTKEELETCANYILWGKDPDGKNPVQKKEIQIETRNKTWSKPHEDESLDALLETPTFNENIIKENIEARPKVIKETFSRKEALEKAPEFLKKTFEQLFNEIDRLDLMLNFYDLKTGKRKQPPRADLVSKFSTEDIDILRTKGESLSQFKYLKLRHHLVELRRQQYTLRDSYSTTIQRETPIHVQLPLGPLAFDTDIAVLPVGLYIGSEESHSFFKPKDELNPTSYTDNDLELISKIYWEKKNNSTKHIIDFREMEHVYNLLLMWDELEDAAAVESVESTTGLLLETLKYYISFAELDEVQSEILDFKIKKVKNQDIADYINKKYNKTYTANYISTIFRQKIIKKINDCAIMHEKIVGNLFFEENFKQCSACKKWILRDADNFVRKSRAKDGLSNRCKVCDKLARQRNK